VAHISRTTGTLGGFWESRPSDDWLEGMGGG